MTELTINPAKRTDITTTTTTPSTTNTNNITTTTTTPSTSSFAKPRAPQPSSPPREPSSLSRETPSVTLTPPTSPGLDSRASLDTTASPASCRSTRSHHEYLESLHVPTKEELARLASVQDQRARERKQHKRRLLHQSVDLVHVEDDARKDFMESRQHHRIQNVLEDARRSHDADDGSRRPSAAGRGDDGDDENVRGKAATLIQRSYRGYRVRREMEGLSLDANTRWTHAVRDAAWRNMTTPRPRAHSATLAPDAPPRAGDAASDEAPSRASTSAARANWRKAAMVARRAGGDEDSSSSSDGESDLASSDMEGAERMTAAQKQAVRKRRAELKAKRRKKAKTMGLPYFLEMVDLKHRYGSNLRQYHAEWKKADTNENFFYWLDYGAGRDIELDSCPRDQLEREQVRYLSREERQAYLVKVDDEGRLCWAKNGIRIDTTEEWKDSINGIVPVDDPTPAYAPALETEAQGNRDVPRQRQQRPRRRPRDGGSSSSTSSTSSGLGSDASESELEAARAAKYATPGLDNAKGLKKIKHVSAAAVFNRLLRKSVRKNTWIFVADTSFRLYVGIKASGAFQHSSFLQGARISAAGLIKVKNGRLASLSPLSGHYRPPASNFRAFVHALRAAGVDMRRVAISKSYAVLVGLEVYVGARRRGRQALERAAHRKDRLVAPDVAARREADRIDGSASAAREREVLRRQAEEDDAAHNPGLRFLRKLNPFARPRARSAPDAPSSSSPLPPPQEQEQEQQQQQQQKKPQHAG